MGRPQRHRRLTGKLIRNSIERRVENRVQQIAQEKYRCQKKERCAADPKKVAERRAVLEERQLLPDLDNGTPVEVILPGNSIGIADSLTPEGLVHVDGWEFPFSPVSVSRASTVS